MARVVSVSTGRQDVRPHDSHVDCFVQVIQDVHNETLVHISTFGSTGRQSPPKSSQSMQFDEAMAKALVSRFVEAFGTKVLPSP